MLYWLEQLAPQVSRIVDAGGHMGTKFRAFRNHLKLRPGCEWIVYDVPAIVKAGRERAEKDGLTGLSFTDDLASVQQVEIFLASGLLQYLDIPFPELIGKLQEKPRHILINKLAVRDGETVVTLENFGKALVPYQVRARKPFFDDIEKMGYRVVDRVDNPVAKPRDYNASGAGAVGESGVLSDAGLMRVQRNAGGPQ